MPMAKPTCRRSDRGSLSLEVTILMPAVLLLLFGVVQGAIWYHARTVATAAANDGAAAARAENAPSSVGYAAAQATLERNAGILRGSSVSVSGDATTVTVSVSGHAAIIFTDWRVFSVTQTVTSPRERVTLPGDN